MLGNPQADAGRFPAAAVEHEHNLLGCTRPWLTSELCKLAFKERDTTGSWQMGHMEESPSACLVLHLAPSGDAEDVAHQSLEPQAMDRRHNGEHPACGTGQDVVRQRPEQRHPLLGGEAFFAALADAQPLLILLE